MRGRPWGAWDPPISAPWSPGSRPDARRKSPHHVHAVSDDLPAHPGLPGCAGRRGVVTSHPDDESFPLPGTDLTRPGVAPIHDHHLGGAGDREVDRQFAERVLRDHPVVRSVVHANRMFQRRVVPYPVRPGIRQFTDIGSGTSR
ncbi:SAM-dependent methyltransferase [Lentzea sp. HUAS12]|uniref:SAM-dependent methyltransferase n=1 Tax=Lentzea sp. HUAS12 TaxID=2951806 RepID=UPI003531B7FA